MLREKRNNLGRRLNSGLETTRMRKGVHRCHGCKSQEEAASSTPPSPVDWLTRRAE